MIRMLISALLLSMPFAGALAVTNDFDHQPSQEQLQKSIAHNKARSLEVQPMAAWPVVKPFNEIENTGFVAISGAEAYELGALREAIARNLPAGVTLVVYVKNANEAAPLKRLLSPHLSSEQLKFLIVPTNFSSNPIWGRDSLPFPVYVQPRADAEGDVSGLVDSIYPQSFEPDIAFANAFGQASVKTGYEFRGGNLLFDEDINCFATRANEILGIDDPEDFFKRYFGCKTLTIMPHDGGIGDIDERVKFLPGKVVLTDNQGHAQILRGMGYDVRMFPSTGSYYRTYMNTLVVNDTIFVPQMGIAKDQDALDAYEAVGFKAVGVYTRQLADRGHGNIHCLTMNYPQGSFVASPLGSDFVKFPGR